MALVICAKQTKRACTSQVWHDENAEAGFVETAEEAALSCSSCFRDAFSVHLFFPWIPKGSTVRNL